MLDGVNGGLDTAAEVEFAQQVLDVDFDGGFCQVQMAGDDFVAVSGGEVAEDFEFARGEGLRCYLGTVLCTAAWDVGEEDVSEQSGRQLANYQEGRLS